MATARLLKKMGKLKNSTTDGKWKDKRLKGSHDKFIGNQRTSIVRKTSNAILSKKAYINPNDLYQPPEKIEDTFEFECLHLTNEGVINKRERGKPITIAIINNPKTLEFVPSNKATSERQIPMLHPVAERAMSIDETAKRNKQFYRHTDVVSKGIGVNLLYKTEEQGKSMQSVYDIANKPYIDGQGRAMQGLYGVKGTGLWEMKKGYEWSSLKRGVYTMAKTAGASAEQLDFLSSISPEQYEIFYEGGLLDFEEYFEYSSHNIYVEKGFMDNTQANQAEVEKFIEKISEYVE